MVSLSFPAAPQSFTLSQETPEDDPKGRQAFQAGWFNDLVTKVSVSFFLSKTFVYLFACWVSELQHLGSLVAACGI